jgi:hypothetical protein
MFRLEGNLVDLRMKSERRLTIPSEFVRHREQGQIHGVTAPYPLPVSPMQVTFVAQRGGTGQTIEIRIAVDFNHAAVKQHVPFGNEAFAGHLEAAPVRKLNLSHR